MQEVLAYFDPLTWPKVALLLIVFLLPILMFRLLTAKSGAVWIAKWDNRIEEATRNIKKASSLLDELTIRVARSRIVELEIASRSNYLPNPEEDRKRLETEVRELEALIQQAGDNSQEAK